MPSAFDHGSSSADFSPLANLLPFDEPRLSFDLEDLLDTWKRMIDEFIVPIIKEITGLDFSSPQAFFLSLVQAIQVGGNAVQAFLDLINTAVRDLISGLLNGNILVNAANLFGTLAGNLFSFIPIGAIGNQPAKTPMVAGTFPDADSLAGNGVWFWDGTASRTGGGTGSARVVADGTLKAMRGVPIAVSQGQTYHPSIFGRWDGYVGTGSPVQLHVVKFAGDEQVGVEVLQVFAPPTGSSAGVWGELSGSYLVEDGVTRVVPRVVVTASASAGTFRFDDGGYLMKSNLLANLTSWLGGNDDEGLFSDPNAFDPRDWIPEPFRDWIGAVLDGLQSPAPKEQPWTDLIGSVQDALGHIPDTNVLGVGGPQNLGESVTSTWNELVGGLVGAIGSGASLSDLWNIANGVSSAAARGGMSFDILGIRSNKTLGSGFLPTSESPVSLDAFAFASSVPTFAVTQSASTIEWHRWGESGGFGAVGWQGSGNASLTGFYVNIWKMDPATGDVVLVHRSPNIVGDISPTLAAHVYAFVDAGIMREPGDVFGAELTVVGSGTHNVAGAASWLPDQLVFPRRFAATRNSGVGVPPSSIASGDVVYSANVPFIEFGVDAGSTPIPRQPQRVKFDYKPTLQTTGVPSWSRWVDLIPLGAGAGGGGALGYLTGAAGRNGQWSPLTLEVGVDIKAGSIVTVSVGERGFGGGLASSGGFGDATVITYIDPDDVEHTLTAAGGAPTGGPSHVGWSPGDVTVNGELYRGGGTATFSSGSTPGGGGGGAFSWSAGSPGAHGAAWVVARQN